MDANDAASYVQNLAGEEANIIFGAMYDDSIPDTAKITVIATGLDDATARQASVADAKKAAEASKKAAFNNAGLRCPLSRCRSSRYSPSSRHLPTRSEVRAYYQQCAEEGHSDSGFPEEQKIRAETAETGRRLRRLPVLLLVQDAGFSGSICPLWCPQAYPSRSRAGRPPLPGIAACTCR